MDNLNDPNDPNNLNRTDTTPSNKPSTFSLVIGGIAALVLMLGVWLWYAHKTPAQAFHSVESAASSVYHTGAPSTAASQ